MAALLPLHNNFAAFRKLIDCHFAIDMTKAAVAGSGKTRWPPSGLLLGDRHAGTAKECNPAAWNYVTQVGLRSETFTAETLASL